MEKNDYPHASEIRQRFADKVQEIKAQQQQQAQQAQIAQMIQQMGVQNGTAPLPQM
jgi:chorismate mutase